MAQLVLGVAGAAVGFMVGGPQGAAYGWMIGVGVGGMLIKQKVEGPKLEDLRMTRVDLGQPLTWVAGSPWVPGNIIYASDKRPVRHTESAGGKGGGGVESTHYTYEIDLLIKLSENPIAGVGGVMRNGELVYGGGVTRSGLWSTMRVYTGEEGQLPDPDFEAAVGAARAQGHLGCGMVFIKSLQLDSGGNLPVLRFLVGTAHHVCGNTLLLINFADGTSNDASCLQLGAGEQNAGEVSTGQYDLVITAQSGPVDPRQGIFWTDERFEHDGEDYAPPITVEGYIEAPPLDGAPDMAAHVISAGDASSPDWLLSIQGRQLYWSHVYSGLLLGSIDAKKHFALVFPAGNGSQARLYFNGSYVATVTAVRTSRILLGGINDSSGYTPATPVRYYGLRITREELYTGTGDYSVVDGGDGVFTLSATTEAPLTNVVGDLMLRAGYSAAQFDVTALASITKPVRGLAISRLTNTRSILELLATTHWFTWQKRGFQIVFVPRPVEPVGAIPFADIGVSNSAASDEPRLELTRPSMIELPARVSVTYPNTLNSYQPDTQVSDYILSQQQSVANQELAVGMTPTEARAVADALQADQLAAMARATIKVPLAYARYEPGDVITITDQDAREFRVRIETRRDQLVYLEFDVVLDDINATLSAGITSGGQTGPDTVQQVAATEWVALDMPRIRDVDGGPGWWVGAAPGDGDLWPGAVLFGSWDGTTYSSLTELPDRAVFGVTTTALGGWSGGNVFDTTNSVTVSINGEASNHTRAAMLADLTLGVWLIGSEVVRARTATLVSAGVYRLSNLIRGFRGTEWAMGTHTLGERVVLINSALRRIEGQQAHIGVERQLKAVTGGLSLTSVTAEAFTDTGIALKPFAPVDLRGAWDADTGDLALTWRRRTRMSHRFLTEGIDPPLGESSELYDVEVWDTGFTTLKRTFGSVTSPAQAYTADEQTTDFGAPQSSVGVRVYQRSEAVGRGYKLQGVV